MNRNYFIDLLNKYVKGEASVEECDLLIKHYNLFDLEPDILDSLTQNQKFEIKDEMQHKILNAISLVDVNAKSTQGGNQKRLFISLAAILIVFLCAGILFFNKTSVKQKISVAKMSAVMENRLIQLPDGSTVIVSPGSKLNYPSSFDGLSKREVYLNGQAYFDIKHNRQKPFIIYTDKLKTTVLGTAFEINAWAEDSNIRVTVSRGKVKVENQFNKTIGIITPNEQIIYDKISENVVQKIVNTPEYLEWKEYDLLLSDVTVAEASKLLEERFKVKIIITDDQIKSKRFTTTYQKGVAIEKILNSIAVFNDAEYTYDQKKAEVIIKTRSEKH